MDWFCAPLQGLACCEVPRDPDRGSRAGRNAEDGLGTWHEACSEFDDSSVTYAAEARQKAARRGLSGERLAGVGIIFLCTEDGALAVSVCVCLCVCVRERERERERLGDISTGARRERQREPERT